MWVCCQLGAREHYSVPRSLRCRDQLQLLVTDVWSGGRKGVRRLLGTRAADRYHPDLNDAPVAAFNWSYPISELFRKADPDPWGRMLARNEWFQDRALRALRAVNRSYPKSRFILFSYSYTARRVFEFARSCGWPTVLGQIDPGLFEEKLVTALYREHGQAGRIRLPPPAYWASWREECLLADRIIVNSEWSYRGVCAEGVAASKLRVVPLAFDPPSEASAFVRRYPAAFTADRPLRVLFLGQVTLRKGVGEILSAVSRLEALPVEFWMVGPVEFPPPPSLGSHPRIRWIGAVPRSAVAEYYRKADVFLFPTFSDGFGLTQLEAQAWRLPVIASRHCAEVVKHMQTGYLLPEVSADAIAASVEFFARDPGLLSRMSSECDLEAFSLRALSARLSSLAEEI